jgi:hypothetical protein
MITRVKSTRDSMNARPKDQREEKSLNEVTEEDVIL